MYVTALQQLFEKFKNWIHMGIWIQFLYGSKHISSGLTHIKVISYYMYFDKYVRLFNKCLRIVFGFDNFTSASHILSLYNLSHISVRVNLKLVIPVFRSVHSGTCSSLLKEISIPAPPVYTLLQPTLGPKSLFLWPCLLPALKLVFLVLAT